MSDDRKFQALIIINFNGIDKKQIHCRRAYVSGLYLGLMIATLYAEADFPKLPDDFSKFFTNPRNQNLELRNFIDKLYAASDDTIKLTEEDFQNSGLMFGIPGSFYFKGIWEAVRTSIVESPKSITWIDKQLDWLANIIV